MRLSYPLFAVFVKFNFLLKEGAVCFKFEIFVKHYLFPFWYYSFLFQEKSYGIFFKF
ncbi:hypothetical protein AAUPMG_12741, partial [Pasteurella multocida subsp. multocida str. Anand1_goat]